MKKKCNRCHERKEGEEVRFTSYSDYVREGQGFQKLWISNSYNVWLCNDCIKQVEKIKKERCSPNKTQEK